MSAAINPDGPPPMIATRFVAIRSFFPLLPLLNMERCYRKMTWFCMGLAYIFAENLRCCPGLRLQTVIARLKERSRDCFCKFMPFLICEP
ncbi:hypothetical protein D3C80_1537950 [compost metagenome]